MYMYKKGLSKWFVQPLIFQPSATNETFTHQRQLVTPPTCRY